MSDFVFVLEQTLGHVAHSQNLERVVNADCEIDPTFLRLYFPPQRRWERVPGLRNWSFRASLAARRALRQRLRMRGADAIFIHTQVAGLLATDLMRQVPTVVSLDATPANFDRVGAAYSHKVSPPAVESVKRAVNRRVFNAAAALVTWCRWAADSLNADYAVPAEKIAVIAPGIDTKLFSPRDRSARSGPVRLLFVGGDFERKGGHDLLRALDGLEGDVEVDLVTADTPAIQSGRVPIHVHRGLRPQSPELVRLYRQADLFVLPARGDCLPQAIAEAMACGLPVVSTRVGAIPELVKDGETGLLVPAASPSRLAEALSRLVASAGRREAMGMAGLELAHREHDMRRNNRSILDLMGAVAHVRSLAASVT